MAKLFKVLVISFFPIFIVNLYSVFSIFILLITNGIQFFLQGKGLIITLVSTQYLKWILLIDFIWIILFLIYLFSRMKYRTESEKHFLQYDRIDNPRICVVIPAYNEELSIQQVVDDHLRHKFVKHVIVIDNFSSDKTVELARQSGAKVITKTENRGMAHSIVLGLKEALNTDANVIALTEADGTHSAYDLDKMLPYLDHCDVVNGSRRVQILTEKGNLRESAVHIWGNYFFSKLLQLKYLNFIYLGIFNISDEGCMLRIFRRKVIEEIHDQLNFPDSDIPIGGIAEIVFLTTKCLDKDFRIIEVPVTYKKRIGESKVGSDKFLKNLEGGLNILWIILRY
ncbi:MAG: glycosyltransferase family 2 protein [Thaumarchaeota archaeon]|nr:glycosyltransferase family 2 protein [Nitrososphaerota archaeon]